MRRIKKNEIERVFILIDWHNVCEMANQKSDGVPLIKYIKSVMFHIQEEISEILNKLDGVSRYACSMRVYHGWHVERQATSIRAAFEHMKNNNYIQQDLSRRIGRVLFFSDFEFGDLIYNDSRYGTIFHTNRSQGQKMIDTAIACDALCLHATGGANRVVIVSDDDDFVPIIISGESQGYKIHLIRRIGHDLSLICDSQSAHICYWGIRQ